MICFAQDALTTNQNWTLISIIGVVFVAVVGLLVWIVKWLCTRFAASVDKCTASVDNNTKVVGDCTTILAGLKERTEDVCERIDEVPQRSADEFQRRKLA